MMRSIPIWCLVLLALPHETTAQEQGAVEYVYHLYKGVLDREPRKGEVELWARRVVDGTPRDEVRAAFLSSDEFYRLHSKDARKFIAAAFVHVYRRPASFEELKYWGDRYWANGGNRLVLSLEIVRSFAPPPPPPPPVIIRLPAEPIPVAQPHPRLVAQAEVGVVIVELFLTGLTPSRGYAGIAGLEEQARTLSAALHKLRRAAAEDAPRRELRYQLRSVQDELFRLRERHRHLNAASPSLRLPSLVDAVDAVDALTPLCEG